MGFRSFINYPLDVLLRAVRRRGYGVQSPSDYAFIRGVVVGSVDLDFRTYMCGFGVVFGVVELRMSELLYRLVSYYGVVRVVVESCLLWAVRSVSYMDCRRVVVSVGELRELFLSDGFELLVCELGEESYGVLRRLLLEGRDGLLVFLSGLEYRSVRCLWRRLVGVLDYGVIYDCGVCGIIILDRSRYKVSYRV